MKRTRRVEIIRYTRRITVVQGGDANAVTHELPFIDITPLPHKHTPPSPEDENRRPTAGETVEPAGRENAQCTEEPMDSN